MTRTPLLCSLLIACFSGGLFLPDARAQNLTTELVVDLGTSVVDIQAPAGDPANRLFLVQQNGRIKVFQNGAIQGDFLDVSAISACCGERGLLGLAFHPDYLNNGRFFINYTNNSGNTRVVEYAVMGNPVTSNVADPAPVQTIFAQNQPFSNHNGGCIQFGGDGKLYVGMGDGGNGNDPGNRAQNPLINLGKMLRFDVDLPAPFIPADNPFVGDASTNDEIWALGLRNPWRFSFDRQTGDMWIGDVGQNAREEIDFEPAGMGGRNYGWRCMEGFNCTGLSGCTCNGVGITLPIHDYGHGGGNCSVTGGYVYRGAAIPGIQGKYFFAEWCASKVWSLEWDGVTATVTNLTAQLSGNGLGNIQAFGEDASGELYMADSDGDVVRIIEDCGAAVYCSTASNSVGAGALISAFGSFNISDNNFLLSTIGLPAIEFGLYYYGPEQIFVPFGDGFRCVGDGATGVFRVNPPQLSSVFGDLTRQIDFTQPPANMGNPGWIAPGTTWNFQCWYRDPGGPGGTNFNLSDAVSVLFCP